MATDFAVSSVAIIIPTIGVSVIIGWLKQRVSRNTVGVLSGLYIYQGYHQTTVKSPHLAYFLPVPWFLPDIFVLI